MARQGHEVFGIDLTLERVQFLRLRSQLLGLENVCAVHGGDGAHLPFASGVFDLVILNGVLEWVAHRKANGKPYDVQLRFLREASRVLSANGHIYVGIENRYGKDYFLGKLEEHARLPWVSLLPRGIADLYARAKTGHSYRTWTYSMPALSSLLGKADFKHRTLLLPIPDYREYFRMVDADSKSSIDAFLEESGKKRLFRALGGRTLIRYIAPSLGMVGHKAGMPDSSRLSRLIRSVAPLNDSTVEKYLVTATDTVVARLRSSSNTFIVRMPLNAAAHQACLQNQSAIQRLSHLSEPWLPKIVASGEFEQSHYFIESAVAGKPITAAMIPAAMRFLVTLHSISVAACDWAEMLRSITSCLAPFFGNSSLLLDLTSCAKEQLGSRAVPRVLNHGDYWRGNILGDDGKITGLVDWPCATFGIPSMGDALHLLVFERSEKGRISIVEALMPFIVGKMPENEKRAVDEYAVAMKIDLDAKTRGAFATLYWLEYLAQRLGRVENRYAANPRWLKKHLSDPASELAAALRIEKPTTVSSKF